MLYNVANLLTLLFLMRAVKHKYFSLFSQIEGVHKNQNHAQKSSLDTSQIVLPKTQQQTWHWQVLWWTCSFKRKEVKCGCFSPWSKMQRRPCLWFLLLHLCSFYSWQYMSFRHDNQRRQAGGWSCQVTFTVLGKRWWLLPCTFYGFLSCLGCSSRSSIKEFFSSPTVHFSINLSPITQQAGTVVLGRLSLSMCLWSHSSLLYLFQACKY